MNPCSAETVKKIYSLCCRLSEKERKKCYKALPSEIRVNELKEEDIFQPVESAAQKMYGFRKTWKDKLFV